MADTGGRGAGGQGGTGGQGGQGAQHTHRTHTQKNSLDFVLLTLLALDVQTLRKSYKAGLEVDLLQRQSIVSTNAICVFFFCAPRGGNTSFPKTPCVQP